MAYTLLQTPRAACLLSVFALAAAQAAAQTSAPVPAPPAFTLQTGTHVVLTDVTVTDSHGNPVQGLPQSAFHILDDGRPQQIASFVEHHGTVQAPVVTPVSAPNVYSNGFLLHPPPVFNVILLDSTNLRVRDQMYLYAQLTKFINALPPDQSLAVCARSGEATLMLQSFTSSHALLQAAVRKAIPHLRDPNSEYATEVDTLQQMFLYLDQLPGRKNILWFSGGASFDLLPDADLMPIDLQAIYDKLESSRIALYPIDARGLTAYSGQLQTEQHFLMEDDADATGGTAIFNSNGLAAAASHVVAGSDSFYTLTYAPADLRFDDKWHKVKVKLDGLGYTLSYRQGYYDDGANVGPSPNTPRTMLQADGEKIDLPVQSSEPIVFEVQILPAATSASAVENLPSRTGRPWQAAAPHIGHRGEILYTLRYTVPAADFLLRNGAGGASVHVGASIVALNSFGRPVAHYAQSFNFGIDTAILQKRPDSPLIFDQQVPLPKGQKYIFISVWDTLTGRLGTLQFPLNAEPDEADPSPSL